MKKIFTLLLTLYTITTFGQYAKTEENIDLSIAFGQSFAPSLSYQKLYGLGQSKRFKIGWGLRANGFFSGEKNYRTAPARLTSGQSSIFALFSDDLVSNIDTLQLSKSSLGSLNAKIVLQYSFKRFDVGFNIDAIGISFGGKQTGKFLSSESSSLNNSIQSASPSVFNLLLISDSDLGSLNSELYASYHLDSKWSLRTGLSFQFLEYKTDRLLTFENDRFRHKTLQPFLAISYQIGHKK
ncbi:hypothetical protein [Flectobacillus longus]|uniref:hypothetical protein n=1 Tax=Flectobacillus longus TaxID=2984207 RepID=UPI0024B798AE|nr:hypothetical protein [Flectobacillus longus]MDI9879373.1 hypothetical protein [Flectobacillus longus]